MRGIEARRSSSPGKMSSHGSAVRTRVGKYEFGRVLGEGSFAKVRLAKNTVTGQNFAVKVLNKERILNDKMVEQIKREISTMKLVKHPNIVELSEVMASKTKIYFVLEYVTGGELFNKIEDGLLHTTCGTPNYVAPEVIVDKGYDGAKADLWSCGVILFVLITGYLPFDDSNIMALYRKIYKADFTCPNWVSSGARKLILRILEPNPKNRITIPKILEDSWFKKGYAPVKFREESDTNLNDIDAIFCDSVTQENLVTEQKEPKGCRPSLMNAFDIISLSKGLNLSGLFEKKQGVKQEVHFTSKYPAMEIITKMEETAKPLGFNVQRRDYKMRLQGSETGRKGHLSVATEVFEVSPSFFVVEMKKSGGDTLEYNKFYKNFSTALKDIVWTTEVDLADG